MISPDTLLIFLRYKDGYSYLGLMQVCFTMGGCLERFFRMCSRIFAQVTTRVTTLAIIPLWKFCTVSNALLLLAHYYIGCCMFYLLYIFSEISTYLYDFQSVNHALPSKF